MEQYVGNAVLAYWPPGNREQIVSSVHRAASKIFREKAGIPDLTFSLAIHFCASDTAGAYFGPKSVQQFQVVGRARDRVRALSP